MFCLLQKRCCSTCLMTWNEWEGTRRMGARPRRGAAAGWGSSGQILPSCRCSPPAKKNNHCLHQHRQHQCLPRPPARTNIRHQLPNHRHNHTTEITNNYHHHQHQKHPNHRHQHHCHYHTPAKTYWHLTMEYISRHYGGILNHCIISLMILFSISPQCLYHSGRERLFDIEQRQNRLNCSTSTWKYWNIEISFCVYICFRISKLLFSCCSLSILPNDVYVCTGLGSGLANTDMLETKTKALRGWESIGRYHKNIWYFDKF